MTRKRKPQRGCCVVCGCAVVAPSDAEKWMAVGAVQCGGCYDLPIAETGWAHGHEFDGTGKLLQVRCPAHGGLGFPRGPVADATVQQ